MRVLLIDNYDSFTWNIVELLRKSAVKEYSVLQYEAVNVEKASSYDKIIISPGPGIPRQLPNVAGIVKALADSKSIFGICLGFQAIAESFGGKLINLEEPVHGRRKKLRVLADDPLFKNMPVEFYAGLYHSWYADKSSLQNSFDIICASEDDIAMGIRHKYYDLRGVLFHPESYMTEFGKELMLNWLREN